MSEVLRCARNFHKEKEEKKKGRSWHFHISFFLLFIFWPFPKKVFSVCIFGQETVSWNHSVELNLSVRTLGQSPCHSWALLPYGEAEQTSGLYHSWNSFLIHSAASEWSAGLLLSDKDTRKMKQLYLIILGQRNCFSQWKWIRQTHFTGLHHAAL